MSLQQERYPDPIIPLATDLGPTSSGGGGRLLHENACRECTFPFNAGLGVVPIARVVDIRTSTTFKLPPDLIVDAGGIASTSGWTQPELRQRWNAFAPADGFMELDFVAMAPQSTVLQVETPIHAHHLIANAGLKHYWGNGMPLKGLRIYAAEGSKDFPLSLGEFDPIDLGLDKG